MKKLKITIAALTALLAVTLSVGTAAAVTIPVDTTADTFKNDPTTCSLREAISAANYDQPVDGCPSGTDGDVVSVPGGTYKIEIAGPDNLGVRGDFDVFWADDLSIVPASADAKVIIDANGVDRVFHQLAGAGKLVIRDMTIMNGNAFDSAGILLGESFELSGLTITGNSAKIAGGIGVVNQGSTGTVVNSTISGNKAEIDGGAIAVDDESSITVKNSTITGNVADSDANGIGDGGGINATAFDASVTLVNTINAGNSDLSPDPADQFSDCRTGPNFFPRYVVSTQAMGQAGCLVGFDPGTNKTVPDVKLSPLADNGGVTPTHMPMAGSPVIDAGGSTAPDLCPEADQVGTVRAPGKCDIGAVEYVEPVIPEPEPDPQPLPGIKVPSNTKAMWDGKNLHVRLKCPARFRPRCLSAAVPVTLKSKKGRAMAKTVKVSTRSNRWLRVKFVIKAGYRAKVDAMTYKDEKLLSVKQVVRSKKVGTRKAKRPSVVYHTYKVRTKA